MLATGNQTAPHSPLPAPDQRKSRAVHPDPHSWVGIRPCVHLFRSTSPGPRPLAPLLQSEATARRTQRSHSHLKTRPNCEQRHEKPQLVKNALDALYQFGVRQFFRERDSGPRKVWIVRRRQDMVEGLDELLWVARHPHEPGG